MDASEAPRGATSLLANPRGTSSNGICRIGLALSHTVGGLPRAGVMGREQVRHARRQWQAELMLQPKPLPVGIELQEHKLALRSQDHVDGSEVDREAVHQAADR